jgi:hypothetical protein
MWEASPTLMHPLIGMRESAGDLLRLGRMAGELGRGHPWQGLSMVSASTSRTGESLCSG